MLVSPGKNVHEPNSDFAALKTAGNLPPVRPHNFGDQDLAVVVTDPVTDTVLKDLGFNVIATSDGTEAIEVFRQHKEEICFVLCDLTMPLMDGWETITSLRKLSPDIPVILTSGFNEAQVMAGDHPTCPDAFLSKPYVRKELIAAIGQALSVKN